MYALKYNNRELRNEPSVLSLSINDSQMATVGSYVQRYNKQSRQLDQYQRRRTFGLLQCYHKGNSSQRTKGIILATSLIGKASLRNLHTHALTLTHTHTPSNSNVYTHTHLHVHTLCVS